MKLTIIYLTILSMMAIDVKEPNKFVNIELVNGEYQMTTNMTDIDLCQMAMQIKTYKCR